jgi:hypothetical protein
LGREPEGAQDAPDLRQAEPDAVAPLDQDRHALERPELGLKAVLARALQQCQAQSLQLPGIEPRGPPRRHRTQCVDAAFGQPGLPGVDGLAGHSYGQSRLRGRPALQQKPTRPNTLAGRFVHLLDHVPHLRSVV